MAELNNTIDSEQEKPAQQISEAEKGQSELASPSEGPIEPKPEVSDTLLIFVGTQPNVKGQVNNKGVLMRIKPTTKMQRVMDAYLKRVGMESDSVRFLYEGVRIVATQTAQDLNMKDGDSILVCAQQTGG